MTLSGRNCPPFDGSCGVVETLEADARRRPRHAEAKVDRPVDFLARAGIVDGHGVAFDGDADMHAHEVVIDPVIVHPIFRLPFAVGHGADRRARLLLAGGEDALDRGINRLRAVFLVELADARDAGAQTGHLGVEVAHHRFRRARIDADDAQQVPRSARRGGRSSRPGS